MNVKSLDEQYIASTYARFPLVIKEGKGALLKDEEGKEAQQQLTLKELMNEAQPAEIQKSSLIKNST